MNAELTEMVRQFIEGELDPVFEKHLLHAIAEDEDARTLLRLELTFRDHFFEVSESDGLIPRGFTDRVMASLAPQSQSRTRRFGVSRWLMSQLRVLTIPISVVFRPVYALALALILVGSLWFSGVKEVGMYADQVNAPNLEMQAVSTASPAEVLIRFVYVDDGASSVAVAGDFTGWEPVALTPQEVDGQVVWTSLLPVQRGEHRYMFVLDDEEWVSDPLAPVQREDGFGNRNAVLVL